MSADEIQRGLRSKFQPESRGGLKLGQVTRVRHRDDPLGGGGGHKPGRGRQKTRTMMFSALCGLAALAVIGGSVVVWVLPRLKPGVADSEAWMESDVKVAPRFPSPDRKEALDLVRRAVTARDAIEIAALYRNGAARSAEIVGFLNALEVTDGRLERYEWLGSMDVNGLLVEGVAVVFKGHEKPAGRIAFLTPDPAGNWQMDFDAFARTVSPSWKELFRNGGEQEQARVRVIAGRDVYYNGPYRDESQWTCYAIVSPDTDELLHGYCRVGTPEADGMSRLFSDGEATSRVTLELRRTKDAEPRQFEISRVLAKDWILPDPAGGDS